MKKPRVNPVPDKPKKIGRHDKLDDEIQVGDMRTTRRSFIVQSIRSGAFDYVAAEAAGISQKTFYTYLGRGEAAQKQLDDGQEVEEDELRFVQFLHDVREARSQARIVAETQVKTANPLAWLKYGPGRERPGQPGWTDTHKVELSGDIGVIAVDEEAVRNRIEELARKKREGTAE